MVKAKRDIIIPVATAKADIIAPGALAGGVAAGALAGRNHDANPSFETDLDGTEAYNCTLTRPTTKARHGVYACKAVQTAFPMIVYKWLGTDYFPVIEGDVYIHSAAIQLETGDSGMAGVGIQWFNEAETLLHTHGGLLVAMSDSAWAVLQVVNAAPANATKARIYVVAVMDDGEAIYIDSQEFRHAPTYIGPYLDGDQEFCFWEGTAHQSVSIREDRLSRPPIGSGASSGLTLPAEAKRRRE